MSYIPSYMKSCLQYPARPNPLTSRRSALFRDQPCAQRLDDLFNRACYLDHLCMENSQGTQLSNVQGPVQGKHFMQAKGLNTCPCSRQRTVVEDNLGTTIYALSVKQVFLTKWHGCTWRLALALLFTIILQLALVGLLLQVSS